MDINDLRAMPTARATHEPSQQVVSAVPVSVTIAQTAADVTCPKCGAVEGRSCITATGYPARTHSARFRAAGVIQSADTRHYAYESLVAARLQRIRQEGEATPYERGYRAGQRGDSSAPAFAPLDASWADRLYERGWLEGSAAQGMAARSDETGTGSAVGNSPVGNADAPKPSRLHTSKGI